MSGRPQGPQPVKRGVGVGHELVALLGGGIEAHRVIHRGMLGIGLMRVQTVHRGGGGKDEVLHLVVAAAFQHVAEAYQIGADIGGRVLQAVAHSGLGGQVDHMTEALRRKEPFQACAVGQIRLDKAEAGPPFQPGQPIPLELHLIVIIAVVQPHNTVTVRHETLCEVVADEAGDAGDKHMHGLAPPS